MLSLAAYVLTHALAQALVHSCDTLGLDGLRLEPLDRAFVHGGDLTIVGTD